MKSVASQIEVLSSRKRSRPWAKDEEAESFYDGEIGRDARVEGILQDAQRRRSIAAEFLYEEEVSSWQLERQTSNQQPCRWQPVNNSLEICENITPSIDAQEPKS
jgi:hypothetical protein